MQLFNGRLSKAFSPLSDSHDLISFQEKFHCRSLTALPGRIKCGFMVRVVDVYCKIRFTDLK